MFGYCKSSTVAHSLLYKIVTVIFFALYGNVHTVLFNKTVVTDNAVRIYLCIEIMKVLRLSAYCVNYLRNSHRFSYSRVEACFFVAFHYLGYNFTLIKMDMDIIFKYLIILVTLSRKHDSITLFSKNDSTFYCGTAVGYSYIRLCARKTCSYLINNSVRIFISRIIRGYDEHIRIFFGSLSHKRTLCTVTVAAAAEQTDKPALCMLLYIRQHIFQCVGTVGIIAHNKKSTFICEYFTSASYALAL